MSSLGEWRRRSAESLERSWARREARQSRNQTLHAFWLLFTVLILALIADAILNSIH